MANRATRHAKPVIAYSSLHNLCEVIYEEKRRKHRKKPIRKYYEGERITERRNGPNTVRILSDLSYFRDCQDMEFVRPGHRGLVQKLTFFIKFSKIRTFTGP